MIVAPHRPKSWPKQPSVADIMLERGEIGVYRLVSIGLAEPSERLIEGSTVKVDRLVFVMTDIDLKSHRAVLDLGELRASRLPFHENDKELGIRMMERGWLVGREN
jgi:hypothetical protein